MGKKSAAKLLERDRKIEVQRRVAAAVRPWHPPCRRARRAGAGRPLRLGRRDGCRVARGAAAGARSRARARRVGAQWFDEPRNRQLIAAAGRGRRPRRSASSRARPEGPAAAGGADLRDHRHARRDVTRRGAAPHRGAGRQGDGLGQQENQTISWSGPTLGASSRKRARWASRRSMSRRS